jgi:acetylornithine/succinyldiaminopimelate/putrescine aminotransferase
VSAEDKQLALTFTQKPLEIVRGEGAYLWDAQGRRYIDLGGASHGVANFGHSHPRITKAAAEAVQRLTHVASTIRSPDRALLLERLHRLVPGHLERTFLANSGTEAVEAALKYAHTATQRPRIVAAKNAFHGRTLGALAVTHKPQYRKPFETITRAADFVNYNDVEALKAAVTRETAAVILEPIQGEGGLTAAAEGYLEAAGDIAHDAGALLIIDEIQTGLGRTGHDLAIQAGASRPDILLLGKSLAGGLPIGVACLTGDVAKSMPPGGHGGTFGGEQPRPPWTCCKRTDSPNARPRKGASSTTPSRPSTRPSCARCADAASCWDSTFASNRSPCSNAL